MSSEEIVEELASPTQSETENGALTASSLLRTFYVNRESVIRTPGAAPTGNPAADELQKQQQQQGQQLPQHQHSHVVTSPPYADHHLPSHNQHHPDSGGNVPTSHNMLTPTNHNMLTPPGSHNDAMASYFSATPLPPHHHPNYAAKTLNENDDEAGDDGHLKSPHYRLYPPPPPPPPHHQLSSPDGYHPSHHPSLHHHAESPVASGLYSVDLNMTPPSSVSPQVKLEFKHIKEGVCDSAIRPIN